METKTKKNLAIWAIALLVLLNVSSLATIWYHRYQFNNNKRVENREHRTEARRGTMAPRSRTMPPFIKESLKLTPDQSEILDSIWQQHGRQRANYEDSLHKIRQQMFAIMAQEAIDTIAYQALSNTQIDLFMKLNQSMLDMNQEVRANLSEEQQKMLAENFKKMRERGPRERRQQKARE